MSFDPKKMATTDSQNVQFTLDSIERKAIFTSNYDHSAKTPCPQKTEYEVWSESESAWMNIGSSTTEAIDILRKLGTSELRIRSCDSGISGAPLPNAERDGNSTVKDLSSIPFARSEETTPTMPTPLLENPSVSSKFPMPAKPPNLAIPKSSVRQGSRVFHPYQPAYRTSPTLGFHRVPQTPRLNNSVPARPSTQAANPYPNTIYSANPSMSTSSLDYSYTMNPDTMISGVPSCIPCDYRPGYQPPRTNSSDTFPERFRQEVSAMHAQNPPVASLIHYPPLPSASPLDNAPSVCPRPAQPMDRRYGHGSLNGTSRSTPIYPPQTPWTRMNLGYDFYLPVSINSGPLAAQNTNAQKLQPVKTDGTNIYVSRVVKSVMADFSEKNPPQKQAPVPAKSEQKVGQLPNPKYTEPQDNIRHRFELTRPLPREKWQDEPAPEPTTEWEKKAALAQSKAEWQLKMSAYNNHPDWIPREIMEEREAAKKNPPKTTYSHPSVKNDKMPKSQQKKLRTERKTPDIDSTSNKNTRGHRVARIFKVALRAPLSTPCETTQDGNTRESVEEIFKNEDLKSESQDFSHNWPLPWPTYDEHFLSSFLSVPSPFFSDPSLSQQGHSQSLDNKGNLKSEECEFVETKRMEEGNSSPESSCDGLGYESFENVANKKRVKLSHDGQAESQIASRPLSLSRQIDFTQTPSLPHSLHDRVRIRKLNSPPRTPNRPRPQYLRDRDMERGFTSPPIIPDPSSFDADSPDSYAKRAIRDDERACQEWCQQHMDSGIIIYTTDKGVTERIYSDDVLLASLLEIQNQDKGKPEEEVKGKGKAKEEEQEQQPEEQEEGGGGEGGGKEGGENGEEEKLEEDTFDFVEDFEADCEFSSEDEVKSKRERKRNMIRKQKATKNE